MQIPKLRRHRERRALTQEELAEKAGVSVRSVAGYETGAGARPGSVRKLAAALDIEVEELLEDEAPKARAPLPFEEAEQRRSLLPHEEPWRVIQGIADEWERALNQYDIEFARLSVPEEVKEIYCAGWFVGSCEAYISTTALIGRGVVEAVEAVSGPAGDAYTSRELAATAEAISRVGGISLQVEEKLKTKTGGHGYREEALEALPRQLLELASKVA